MPTIDYPLSCPDCGAALRLRTLPPARWFPKSQKAWMECGRCDWKLNIPIREEERRELYSLLYPGCDAGEGARQ
jgi:hypothetical protein